MLSRRTFVSWLGGIGAAFGIGARARTGDARVTTEAPPEQAASLDLTSVTRLAQVVLPGELGDAGFSRVSRGFTQWLAGYREGQELVHPYGSTNLQQTGGSPARRWRDQLAALDRDARARHQRGFNALTREQRREIVHSALGTERTNRMPEALDASHVALALVAWFFATPEASNLCYQSRIDRNQCRPLVNAPRQPLPLVGSGQRAAGRGDSR
jgi:hypothetical protein